MIIQLDYAVHISHRAHESHIDNLSVVLDRSESPATCWYDVNWISQVALVLRDLVHFNCLVHHGALDQQMLVRKEADLLQHTEVFEPYLAVWDANSICKVKIVLIIQAIVIEEVVHVCFESGRISVRMDQLVIVVTLRTVFDIDRLL